VLACGALSTGSGNARRLQLSAAAKVNVALEVLSRRADGYHEIATVMQTVDLSDRLVIEDADVLEIRTSAPGVPTDERNLAYRAAAALREAAGIERGARITLDKRIPADLDVHLICDNYATHKTPAVATWLAGHPRFHMHHTPTYASWLNQVERWFALLTDKKLRRGAHRSIQALEKDIRDWITNWNDNPKPFTWTKTADEILERLASYIQRIPGAGH